MPTNDERLARLEELRAQSRLGGGAERVERQHAWGKLTARERLDLLLDTGSFVELDAFVTHRATEFGMAEQRILGDGVVTGHGMIDGRLVVVFSQRYATKTGIGTLVSMMLPYSLTLLVSWTMFLLVYWLLGIPLGLQAPYVYPS